MVITACTLDKIDYEAELATAIPQAYEFEEVVLIESNGYRIEIEALNGTFYKGYNELHFTVTNMSNNQTVDDAAITWLPIRQLNTAAYSCPHSYNVLYDATNGYYSGYSVFDYESGLEGTWEFYMSVEINGELFTIQQGIEVMAQPNMNLNMTTFTGADGISYYIALVAPVSPSVAENDLVAGIYQYNQPEEPAGVFPDPSQFSFSEVQGATVLLDPRMPEASMGNHSSPNNEDLTQMTEGLYHGVVNYTMTGNWTLNFMFLDADGNLLAGTEVPTDFTPGIEGAKSELYIDILF
ncbi:hypothetical protein Y10_22360 [Neptunitalea sp. Y10]|uniref:YtkA-like domain-containing protein n=2 Tax=Neptunitalea lumnitzerae TaxID=2965509 RepID=A0ABQ5MKD2_9FLAO|nr:hypothetical protein Y10_22360 [Neptunitalea sp. Y10]